MNEEQFARLSRRIDTYRQDVIRLQKHLVAVPALAPESGGEGELQKAIFIKDALRKIGFDEITEANAKDDRVPSGLRPNLIAKIFGNDRSRTFWILTHMDVVPPGDMTSWTSDPYKLRVDGDRLIGRGTEDNHQGLVSALLAAKALRDEEIVPEMNLGLVIVSDEETGNRYGLEIVLKKFPHEFKKHDLILVPDAGDPKGEIIEIAEKSVLWLKFIVTGSETHGSTPHLGNNANRAAAHLTVLLDSLYADFNAVDLVFEPPMSTFEPTKREANILNINTIPAQDTLYWDCRILPQYPVDQVMQKITHLTQQIEREFRVQIAIETIQRADAAPATPADSNIVCRLQKALQKTRHFETKLIGIGGGTVAAIFRKQGLSAAVWSTIADNAHKVDEYSLISNTLKDAQVMVHICLG